MPPPSFERLNLKWNPFGEPSLEERLDMVVADPLLPSKERVVQYLGGEGYGKSTHLLATLQRVCDAKYHYIAEGEDSLPFRLEAGSTYLIDEAQRLRRSALRRLLNGRHVVAVGSHEDVTPWSRVPVESVVVTTDTECLSAILERRIEWARLGPGPVPTVDRHQRDALLHRFGGNVRAIEDHLYEEFEALRRMTSRTEAAVGQV